MIRCDKCDEKITTNGRKGQNDKYEHASQIQFAPSSTCPLVCLSACLLAQEGLFCPFCLLSLFVGLCLKQAKRESKCPLFSVKYAIDYLCFLPNSLRFGVCCSLPSRSRCSNLLRASRLPLSIILCNRSASLSKIVVSPKASA